LDYRGNVDEIIEEFEPSDAPLVMSGRRMKHG
jgi:hypothetical protein